MIRPIKVTDIESFIKIRLDALKINPEAFGASYEDGIDWKNTYDVLSKKNEEDFILGYFDNSQLVGMVGFIRFTGAKRRHKGYIWGMFVYPDFRGKSIGKSLMEACLQKAQMIPDLEQINLSVISKMQVALHLYKQFGFEEFGTELKSLKIDGEYLDEIHMKYPIKKF